MPTFHLPCFILVEFVSFVASIPSFVPGLGDHGVFRLVPPRPRRLIARLHSTRARSIDRCAVRVFDSRPRDRMARLVTERDGAIGGFRLD